MGTGIGLLTTVGAGVLGETCSHAESLATKPAAERPQATVDPLVVPQMGQLAETLATCGALVERMGYGKRGKCKNENDKRLAGKCSFVHKQCQCTNSTLINIF